LSVFNILSQLPEGFALRLLFIELSKLIFLQAFFSFFIEVRAHGLEYSLFHVELGRLLNENVVLCKLLLLCRIVVPLLQELAILIDDEIGIECFNLVAAEAFPLSVDTPLIDHLAGYIDSLGCFESANVVIVLLQSAKNAIH
jgi:hypothetical protein